MKFGINYLYSTLRDENYGNQNGTFVFSRDRPFDANDPRTYPERFSIRVPGAVNFLVKGHFIGVFLQDKWKINNKLTVNVGARYDIEFIPTENADNPLFAGSDSTYPIDRNNASPRVGLSYAPDSRSVVRAGAGVFYQRTSYTFLNPLFTNTPFSTSFTASFPTQTFDPGPRQGRFPTEAMLVNGPVINRALIDAMFPPGSLSRNTSTVRFDSPDREVPWARQYSIGYERQLGGSASASLDLIRSEQRKQYMLFDLNPPLRSTGLATGQLTRRNPDPSIAAVGAVNRVETFRNIGWIDYTSLPALGGEAHEPRQPHARLVRVFARPRQYR